MFRTSLIAGAALSALIVAACSKPAAKTDAAADTTTRRRRAGARRRSPRPAAAPMTAADFVTKAASTDMFEKTEAKMAEKMGTSPDVKKFAAMMITDHTKSTADLKAAIAKSGQTLPIPAALPADMQAKVDALAKMTGADFDKGYITQQVEGHTMALGVMQGYSMGGDVPALKDFATSTTKVVQMHLDMAQKLQASMK